MALTKRQLRWPAIGLAALAVLGTGTAYAVGGGDGADHYRTVAATTADVQQTLSTTGLVDAAKRADLSFGTSGTLKSWAVQVGDSVTAGQVLGRLDAGDLDAALTQAKADLARAVAQLASDEEAQVAAVSSSSTASASSSARSSAASGSTPSGSTPSGSTPSASAPSGSTPSGSTPSGSTSGSSSGSTTSPATAALLKALKKAQDQVVVAQSHASQALAAAKDALAAQQQACAAASDPAASESPSANASPTDSDTSPTGADSACTTALTAVQQAQEVVADAQDALAEALDALGAVLGKAVSQTQAQNQTRAKAAVTSSTTGTTTGATTATPSATSTTSSPSSSTGSPSSSPSSSSSSSSGAAAGATTVTAAQLASDQAKIEEANASVITAQQNRAQATLRSTRAGTVVALDAATGDTVSAGSTVVTVVGGRSVTVTGSVSEAQVASVKVGQPVQVSVPGISRATNGTVTAIGLVADSSSGTTSYPVTVTVENPTISLPAGSRALVKVVLATAKDVVTVPTSAVTRRGTGSAATVSTWNGSTLTRRTVQLGAIGAKQVAITSGLSAGTEVVLADIDSSITGASSTVSDRGGFSGAPGQFRAPAGGTGGPPTFSSRG